MHKLGWILMLVLLLWVLPPQHQAQAAGTGMYLDGKRVESPSDAGPEMVDGKIMVPLRIVGEQLGYQFNWEPQMYKVTLHKNSADMSMFVGRTTANVNGKEVALDSPPILRGSSTMVPLRFVGEQMGLKVDWNNSNKSVYLETLKANTDPGTPHKGSSTTDQSGKTPSNQNGKDEGLVEPVDTKETNQPQVQSISFSDNRLLVSLDSNVKAKVFTMTGPDRIVIDFPNSGFASSFAAGYAIRSDGSRQIPVDSYPDIQEIRFASFSSSSPSARVVIVLSGPKAYDVINEGEGQFILALKDQDEIPVVAPIGSEGRKIVVLDAGHGATDSGAKSITGRAEKEFNLAVVLKVEKLLQNEPNIDLILTRSGDTYPTLDERANIANSLNADVFLSVHANSMLASNNGKANGSETYYARPESKELATVMHKYLVGATGFKDNGLKVAAHLVTRKTTMPAVLLECGYLSNALDEASLYSGATQQRIAEGIVSGLKEYLRVN